MPLSQPHAVIAPPKVKEVRDDSRPDHLTSVEHGIGRVLTLTRLVADQQATHLGVDLGRHGFTLTAAVAVRSFAH